MSFGDLRRSRTTGVSEVEEGPKSVVRALLKSHPLLLLLAESKMRPMESDFMLSAQRRKAFEPASIERLVRAFYERVQNDEELGPVFAKRVEDWEPHLQRMMAFWASVLRGEGGYKFGPKGSPPQIHRGISELRLEHFERWLTLFEEVAEGVFAPDAASFVVGRAHRMGHSLSAHLRSEAKG